MHGDLPLPSWVGSMVARPRHTVYLPEIFEFDPLLPAAPPPLSLALHCVSTEHRIPFKLSDDGHLEVLQ